MSKKFIPSFLAIFLVFSVAASQMAFANDVDSLIKERVAGFKKSKKSIEEIGRAIDKQDNAALVEQAVWLQKFAAKIPELYPENAKGGFFSRAKKSIWDNFDDYKEKAADFNKSAMHLEKLASANASQNELTQQLKNLEQSCQSCHKPYRKGL